MTAAPDTRPAPARAADGVPGGGNHATRPVHCPAPTCHRRGPVGAITLSPTPDLPPWLPTRADRTWLARERSATAAAEAVLLEHIDVVHRVDVGAGLLRLQARAAAVEVARAARGREPDPRPTDGVCAGCGLGVVRIGDRWHDDTTGGDVCLTSGQPCPDLQCLQHAIGADPDCAHCGGQDEVYSGHTPLADVEPDPTPPRTTRRRAPSLVTPGRRWR